MFLSQFDQFVSQKVDLLSGQFLDEFMILTTSLMNVEVLSVLLFILFLLLLSRRQFKHSLLLVLSSLSTIIAVQLIKLIIERARPLSEIIEVDGYSFPSAHSAMAMVFFGLLIYFFKKDIKNTILKNLFIALNVILIFLVGLSRIYLDVHWFSDVVGGFGIGLFFVIFYIWLFMYIKLKN